MTNPYIVEASKKIIKTLSLEDDDIYFIYNTIEESFNDIKQKKNIHGKIQIEKTTTNKFSIGQLRAFDVVKNLKDFTSKEFAKKLNRTKNSCYSTLKYFERLKIIERYKKEGIIVHYRFIYEK